MTEHAAVRDDLAVMRLSVAQYHAMRDAHILGEDDRIELLDGLLVPKMTKKPPHRLGTSLARVALEAIVPAGWYVDEQEPITTDDSEPEPDVSVVRGARRDYADRHPLPEEVALVVEVADESLKRDRGAKKRIYARAGIPQYWIVNLRARLVEVYSAPAGDDYAERSDVASGSEVAVIIDGREIARIAVDSLLP
jgi:Uma2 family endonuclease